MKILVATPSRGVIGGAEIYLSLAIPWLARRGHDVALLYECPEEPPSATIDPTELDIPRWCSEQLGSHTTLQRVREWTPDIVYSHGLAANTLEEELVSHFPVVLHAHNYYYGTCLTGSKRHAFPSARPCRRRFGAACLVLHYPRRCGGLDPATMVRSYYTQKQRRARLPRYRSVIVASSHMASEYVRHGVASTRLHRLPYPVTPQNDAGSHSHATSSPSKLLFISRLTDLKGGTHLIRAMRAASDALTRTLTLSIAGTGPEQPALEALAKRLDVPATFYGWVRGLDRHRLFQESDLLAIPSVWPEPFGIVGIEAATYGIPSVGYGVGGIVDWLEPGVTGELAPGNPPTVRGLASALVRVLESPTYYQSLCEGAKRMAQHYNPDDYFRRLDNILEQAIAG